MPIRENALLDQLPSRARPSLHHAQGDLLERAAHLDPSDRMMLELAIKNHLTHRQLASIMHIPAGTVTRRLRRLINRLSDPLVIILLSPANQLPADYRQLAIDHLLRGRSVTQLAEETHRPATQIRQMLEFVRGWHRGMVGGRRGEGGTVRDLEI